MVSLDVQEQILEKLQAMVVVVNRDGSVDYVSKAASQLLGYNPEDLIGNNWWDKTRINRIEELKVKKKIYTLFSDNVESLYCFEHLLRTSSGLTKWIRWNVSLMNTSHAIGIGYDITDNKNQEELLRRKNQLLKLKNKDITDSINYARHIQQATLQNPDGLSTIFKEAFILYKPKDIVSGDYYWYFEDDSFKFVAAVDCTGHGVPGAMMSLVANSIFKEVFVNQKLTDPAEIIYAADKELFQFVNNHSRENCYDGMDVALIRVCKITSEIVFCGASRSIFIVNENCVDELKGNRNPVGYYEGFQKTFENIVYQPAPESCVYLFSDGFIDQFGGENNTKMNKGNFKALLQMVNDLPMEEQGAFLDYSFNNWKQDFEQTDDVLVIGLRL